MDWAAATARNRDALLAIVAALFAMLGLPEGAAERIPQAVYRAVLRILTPAESAARRLIVIAARGLVVKVLPSRPMPKGRIIGKGGKARRVSFQLFDPLRRFSFEPPVRYTKTPPRVWCFGGDPRVAALPMFQPPEPAPAPAALAGVDGDGLGRRLQALKAALDDLPRQARRLARWRVRRQAAPRSARVSPIRIGRPPGHRRKPDHDVDFVLAECHGLAWDIVQSDTS